MDDDGTQSPVPARQTERVRRPRSRILRWMLRLTIFVGGLAIAIAVILQIILWTDLPRRLVLGKLQNVLGLRVEAPRMQISWSGQTVLEDVKISLPLVQQAFLDVPRMEVSHTSLPMILLTQQVTVDGAIFRRPTVLLSQDASGKWNVAEAVDLVTRAGGKKQAQEEPAKQIVLPAVTAEEGTLKLIDRTGKSSTIQPLFVSGQPSGPLVWKYEAKVENRLRLTGQVSPGGVWEHEVAFAVGEIEPWIAAWTTRSPQLRTAGTWHGKVEGSTVGGRIVFDQLAVGSISAQGAANIQRSEDGTTTVIPTALVVQTNDPAAPKVTLNSGTLVLGANNASAKDLGISVGGGEGRLSGDYSWGDQSANLQVAWRDITLPRGITNEGSAEAHFRMPWPGAPRLEANIASSGKSPGGAWDARFKLTGDGRSWKDIDWTATFSRAQWSGERKFDLADAEAIVLQRDNRLTLQSISLASNPTINGNGEFNLQDESWRLAFDGSGIRLPRYKVSPVAVHLRANGKGKSATLEELLVTSVGGRIRGEGFFDPSKPKPVYLTLEISHLPPLEGSDINPLVRGQVYGKASFSGTLDPVDLNIDQGMLYGSNVVIGDRPVGKLAIQLEGQVTADRAHLQTTEAQLLGGKWRVYADWQAEQEALRVRVNVNDLRLADAADVLHQKGVGGELDGAWTIDIPAIDLERISASGTVELTDLFAGAFRAQRATARMQFGDGQIVVDPIRVEQSDGAADLRLDASAQTPTLWNLSANISNWPAGDAKSSTLARIWAQSELVVDLKRQSATGPVNSQLTLKVQDRDAGSLSIQSRIDGRVIQVSKLDLSALGGEAHGAGVLPIDDPMKATATAAWKNLDAAQLAAFVPGAEGLSGTVSGSAALEPTDDPRALGPLKLAADMRSADLHYSTIDIGDASLSSYFTGKRFVLDDSTVRVAGGEVRFWARSTQHPGDVRSSQLQFEFKDLDLDRIQRALNPDPKSMPGKLAGNFALIGSLEDRDTLFGSGTVRIKESNLTNFKAVDKTYDYMNVSKDGAKNDGSGVLKLRLDNNTLVLENGSYFNRGVQLRTNTRIKQIWGFPDSPIEGTVIGSLRPLKDIKLPYFADADRILNALQQNLTTVRVHGTARDYQVVPTTLDQADETLRKVILGEVQER